MDKEFNFTLNQEDLAILNKVLSNAPYGEVVNLVNKLNSQMQESNEK